MANEIPNTSSPGADPGADPNNMTKRDSQGGAEKRGDKFSFGDLVTNGGHFHFGESSRLTASRRIFGAAGALLLVLAIGFATFVVLQEDTPRAAVAASVEAAPSTSIGTIPGVTEVSGELYQDGSLTQYATYRTSTGGSISITVEDMPATTLRIGLRDQAGEQFGGSLEWKEPGTQTFGHFPAGTQFALNARMTSCDDNCKHTWAGTLNH